MDKDMDILEISMFGGFRYSSGTNSITKQLNHSKKMTALLAYLIVHREKSIAYTEFIDVIWPNTELLEPLSALKTLLYRLRTTMKENGLAHSQDCILSKKGTYRWNIELPCKIDVLEFEQLCKDAALQEMPAQEKIEKLTKATQIYRGEFLPECALDEWAVPISTYYHSMYLRCVNQLIGLLKEEENYAVIVDVCRKALLIEQFDEGLHIQLITALINQSKNQEALAHYDFVTNLFYKELGITPSDEIRNLYRKISDTQNALQTDLNIIKEDLRESGKVTDAFFCEYEFFKEIYRLEARIAGRSGASVYIGLLSVSDRNNNQLPVRKLSTVMADLLTALKSSLRKGDVIARYSSAQYVIMLPVITYENGIMVMERILNCYKNAHPKSPASIQYKLQPLDPIE